MVLWNPKNISEINIAVRGIIKAIFFLKWDPENKASPPIGAKFGAWGIRRATTDNKIIVAYGIIFLVFIW